MSEFPHPTTPNYGKTDPIKPPPSSVTLTAKITVYFSADTIEELEKSVLTAHDVTLTLNGREATGFEKEPEVYSAYFDTNYLTGDKSMYANFVGLELESSAKPGLPVEHTIYIDGISLPVSDVLVEFRFDTLSAKRLTTDLAVDLIAESGLQISYGLAQPHIDTFIAIGLRRLYDRVVKFTSGVFE